MFACIHNPDGTAQRQSLFDLAYTFSPRVEDTAPDAVVLDIDGLEHLFGPPLDIADRIVQLAAGNGMRVHVGIASNPDAAVHAARGLGGIAIVPAGQEAYLLGNLPVSVLFSPLSNRAASVSERSDRSLTVAALWTEIEETLKLWGIRTFRDLAALPEAGVSQRLGAEGLRLQKLARGAGDRQLVPVTPVAGFENSIDLEYPVALLEPLAFILARLLNQLWAGLEARALATDELRLRLKLEDQTEHQRTLRLPFPTRDHRACLKLMQLDLETHPPQAPIVAVRLAANPVKPRVLQNGLFIPLAPEPDKLELVLARLANLAGAENVGSAELLDTHRPDAFQMRIAECGLRSAEYRTTPHSALRIPHSVPCLAFRAFRPPLRAKVQASHGCPARVMARGVNGEVVSLAGPWRSSGDWWKSDNWDRDEWDVALSDGALYRIYWDRLNHGWFIEGSYD